MKRQPHVWGKRSPDTFNSDPTSVTGQGTPTPVSSSPQASHSAWTVVLAVFLVIAVVVALIALAPLLLPLAFLVLAVVGQKPRRRRRSYRRKYRL